MHAETYMPSRPGYNTGIKRCKLHACHIISSPQSLPIPWDLTCSSAHACICCAMGCTLNCGSADLQSSCAALYGTQGFSFHLRHCTACSGFLVLMQYYMQMRQPIPKTCSLETCRQHLMQRLWSQTFVGRPGTITTHLGLRVDPLLLMVGNASCSHLWKGVASSSSLYAH